MGFGVRMMTRECEACGKISSGMHSMGAGRICSSCLNEAVERYLKQIQLVKDMKKEDNHSNGAWWA